MATIDPRFTPEQCALWRQETMKKSRDTAERLSNILNAKNGTLSGMARSRRAALDLREKKVRSFLDLLAKTLQNIGSPDFGKCTACDTELSAQELSAMPWATRCKKCPEVFGFTRDI